MKVLWVCNVPVNLVTSDFSLSPNYLGGWLTGLLNSIRDKDIELVYCFPIPNRARQTKIYKENVLFINFFTKGNVFSLDRDIDDKMKREQIRNILLSELPDLVHIHGTEFMHSLIFAEEAKKLDIPIICSVQGLVSQIRENYSLLLPPEVKRKVNLSTLIRGTIRKQERYLKKRGQNELKCLQLADVVVGRTEWDRICTKVMIPHRKYITGNEVMRIPFYNVRWNYEHCEKYTIFVSQGSSPLKGLNILIEAINILRKQDFSVELFVAGNNFIDGTSLYSKMKRSTYGDYIYKLLKKYNLLQHVHFLGYLDENQMVEQMLKCNIFVSSSSIENSSNSVCEAMLLGVPIVSSFVGGVTSLFKDEHDGLFYPQNSVNMLVSKIIRILEDPKLAQFLGDNANTTASTRHNPQTIANELYTIYEQTCN